MASRWSRIGRQLSDIALREGPRLLKELQRSGGLSGPRSESPAKPVPAGRPASTTAVPTAHRARTVEYAPDLDGRADPGEVVWTWVAYEEDPGQGKDRPVLVVGRNGGTLLGLMLSSNADRDGQRNWMGLGSGAWDGEHRPSWIRLDRVLDVPESGIRRKGAILERDRFDRVAARLRRDYNWS
ncbi:type II toxin-antitoxin system PemK/MazF family toxin [Rhodococcus sp. NPDC003318]|uniref:type II toxin-antitoxin system PemK/MazF family toxin n=1 Tax=Rhodococcus sp. NPDC003318 TaxID=3364503 RepID=UPI00369A2EDD